MIAFELNDLCIALRAFDEKLKEHVEALDEKPVQADGAELSPQPTATAAARKGSISVADDKRGDKVGPSNRRREHIVCITVIQLTQHFKRLNCDLM